MLHACAALCSSGETVARMAHGKNYRALCRQWCGWWLENLSRRFRLSKPCHTHQCFSMHNPGPVPLLAASFVSLHAATNKAPRRTPKLFWNPCTTHNGVVVRRHDCIPCLSYPWTPLWVNRCKNRILFFPGNRCLDVTACSREYP